MYSAFRQWCEQLLRIPPRPEPPPGDEAQTRIFLAAKNYYKYLLVLWALKLAITLLAMAFVLIILPIGLHVSRSLGEGWVLLFFGLEALGFVMAVIGGLFTLALVRLDFDKRWYVVTDRSLRVREGIVHVREATVTFANIQNISISQGPLQRALRIADLRVDTAGGGGVSHGEHGMTNNLHTVWFRGVDNANEIKELMQQRLRQLKDSGLGDHDDLPAHTTMAISSSMVAALREVRAEAEALHTAASLRFGGR